MPARSNPVKDTVAKGLQRYRADPTAAQDAKFPPLIRRALIPAFTGAHLGLGLLGLLLVAGADAEPDDAPKQLTVVCDTPLRTEQGSASILLNLTGNARSIRAKAKDMLETAVLAENQHGCLDRCESSETPSVIFNVAPLKFLPEKDQSKVCQRLADETQSKPFRFGPNAFANVEQLDSRIMKFTHGMGDDGKLLYQQCSENCDPRYTFIIERAAHGFSARADVFCGFARDQGHDDMFQLQTSLRHACPASQR